MYQKVNTFVYNNRGRGYFSFYANECTTTYCNTVDVMDRFLASIQLDGGFVSNHGNRSITIRGNKKYHKVVIDTKYNVVRCVRRTKYERYTLEDDGSYSLNDEETK